MPFAVIESTLKIVGRWSVSIILSGEAQTPLPLVETRRSERRMTTETSRQQNVLLIGSERRQCAWRDAWIDWKPHRNSKKRSEEENSPRTKPQTIARGREKSGKNWQSRTYGFCFRNQRISVKWFDNEKCTLWKSVSLSVACLSLPGSAGRFFSRVHSHCNQRSLIN